MDRESDESRDDSDFINRRDLLAAAGGVAAASIAPTIASANRTPISDGEAAGAGATRSVESPDGAVEITLSMTDAGPCYSLSYGGTTIVEPSSLGLEFRDADPLAGNLRIAGTHRRDADTTWEPLWGETAEVRNHYNELAVGLTETGGAGRSLTLVFRAYDDGAAFRYVLPDQADVDEFVITNERTRFAFAGDYRSWWIPDNWENYEYLYEETPLSEISNSPDVGLEETDAANTPVTMKVDDDCYVSVHEAALTDYAAMTLSRYEGKPTTFEGTLVPWPDGAKVKAEAPHASPWRTFTLGSTPGDLAESKLILNLNEPNKLEDTSWIDPGKYMGIWWELHVGKSTWAPGPDVGATTANAKRYMDFASEHGIGSLLVEGWNVGWAGGFDSWSNPPYSFDFTESIDQYDLEEVVEYGESLDPPVGVTIHNETGGGVGNYIEQVEEAYQYYEELGIHSAKLGYVSEEGVLIDDEFYTHHGQRMVNHYRYVTKLAADHEIMLNVHEPIKPTGVRRTWPNLLTREGASGLEYENFRPEGNPPAHTLTLPFTRILGGPFDYTPGIFDVTYPEYGDTRVHDTRARQLALYPILFSGLQMVADLPENYDDLDEFEFVENVPASWDETTVLESEIGRYATFARRKDEEWYVGSGTDDTPRALDVPLDFLSDGHAPYVATVYTDGEDADYETNPTSVQIDEFVVDADDTLVASMIEGGGQAVRLRPKADADATDLPHYEYPDYEYDSFVVLDELMVSESTTATLEVTNTGTLIGGETLHLYLDGEPVASRFARIPAGDTAQIDFPLQPREPGTYEVAVGPSPDELVASGEIEVTPTSEEFEWLSFDGFDLPETVEQGTAVEVTGTVTNTGSEETLQVVKMTVDDEVVLAKGIDLQPGAETELTFEHTFEGSGEFSVAIENLGPWTVTVPEPGATSGI
jgi:alpha-glucosidase